MSIIVKFLELLEDYRNKVYYCSEGYPTIAIGQKIGPRNAPLEYYDFTVSKELARAWCMESVDKIILEIKQTPRISAAYDRCNDDRKAILISMAYQMGVSGLSKFKNMLKALSMEDWERASSEALNSRWAKQTPGRASDHADVLLHGDLFNVYPTLRAK